MLAAHELFLGQVGKSLQKQLVMFAYLAVRLKHLVERVIEKVISQEAALKAAWHGDRAHRCASAATGGAETSTGPSSSSHSETT